MAVAKSREPAPGKPASGLIDQRIRDLGGWRGETLARMRALILEGSPVALGACPSVQDTEFRNRLWREKCVWP